MRVPLQGGGADGRRGHGRDQADPGRRTEIFTDRSELLAPVLARRRRGAGRAPRPLGRPLSDAVLVTDAIAAAAPEHFADGRVRFGLDERRGGIELRVGPMEAGAATRIREDLEVPDVGGSLETLADELTVEESDDGEYLLIRFAAARCSLICSRIRDERPAQDPRDVHLRVADPLGDLRLGHVLGEAQAQHQRAPSRRGAAAPRRARSAPRPARSRRPRSPIRSAGALVTRLVPGRPAGPARAAGGRGWPRTPRARRPAPSLEQVGDLGRPSGERSSSW